MHRWAFVLITLSLLRGGDGPLDRATLRGVKAMNVVIDRLDPDLEKAGLTQDALRSRVAERLRKAGLTIDPKALEFVGLRVGSFLAKKGPDSLSLSLAFYQPVVLVRDQKVRTASQTWEVETMLMVAPKPMVQSALETVDQLADQFVSAYQAANPR
jgi:hypothetical protein